MSHPYLKHEQREQIQTLRAGQDHHLCVRRKGGALPEPYSVLHSFKSICLCVYFSNQLTVFGKAELVGGLQTLTSAHMWLIAVCNI